VTLPPCPTPDGRKRYGKPSPLAVLLRPHGPCQMNLLTRLQRCGP
jgi:hypothetical protein